MNKQLVGHGRLTAVSFRVLATADGGGTTCSKFLFTGNSPVSNAERGNRVRIVLKMFLLKYILHLPSRRVLYNIVAVLRNTGPTTTTSGVCVCVCVCVFKDMNDYRKRTQSPWSRTSLL